MTFLQRIEEDLKTAMKAKDAFRLGVLRMVKAAIKNKELEPPVHTLSDAEAMQVLSSMIKQRKDSVDQYTQAGRADMAESEAREIEVIQEYLPKPLTEAEVTTLIQDAIQKVQATGPKDMGLIMKELKEPTLGRYDGKLLSEQVKSALSQLG